MSCFFIILIDLLFLSFIYCNVGKAITHILYEGVGVRMTKVSHKYDVTVRYTPQTNLDKLARGYAVMIKVAIRIIEQGKELHPNIFQDR
jgi:hypothetical protein